MMSRLALPALLALAGLAASPAAAVTLVFNFAGPSGATNVASVSRTTGGVTLTAAARTFTAAPGTLTNLSQLTASGTIRQTSPGIGVTGGASADQLDTNQPANREAILVTASRGISISGLRLSFIDNDDTLRIYGVNPGGSLTSLGFGGEIISGLASAASFSHVGTNSGTTTLNFASPTAFYTNFVFTTREGGDVPYLGTLGQGYRIDRITGMVPEPASWAMLVLGFGIIGASTRRRSRVSSVLA